MRNEIKTFSLDLITSLHEPSYEYTVKKQTEKVKYNFLCV